MIINYISATRLTFLSALLSLFCLLGASRVSAQKYAPVWSSYLKEVSLSAKRQSLEIDVIFNKNGGPSHRHVQMYFLAYLEKDEAEILKLKKSEELTLKTKKKEELIIDVLLKRKLAVSLGDKISVGEWSREGTLYSYNFAFKNADLLKKMGELKAFDKNNHDVAEGGKYFPDRLKIIVFVPVNDCAYAEKARKANKEHGSSEDYDFAFRQNERTLIQYFKPLPHRFLLKALDDNKREQGVVLLYVD